MEGTKHLRYRQLMT